jgi:hypothetical protein
MPTPPRTVNAPVEVLVDAVLDVTVAVVNLPVAAVVAPIDMLLIVPVVAVLTNVI